MSEINNDRLLYVCKNCNSKFLFDNNEIINCIYCDSLLERCDGNLINVEYIIPFKYDKSSVIKIYKKNTRFKLFLPFKFRRRAYIEKINNVYVPFFITDLQYEGNMLFGASSSSEWMDGKYSYLETKKYDIIYDGFAQYNGNVISCNNIIEQQDIKYLEPLEFNGKTNYDESIVYNIPIEVFNSNNSLDEVKKIISNKVSNMMSGLITYEKKGIKKNNMFFSDSNSYCILLPMWVLTYNFDNKKYKFIFSDSNDKVYMDLPVGKTEKIIVGIIIFLSIFLGGFLISYFF